MFPFDSRSPQIEAIAQLFNLEMAISAVILLIVTGGVLLAARRFRHRPGDPEPEQVEGNRWLEITWTGVPLLLLVLVFAYSLRSVAASDPPTPADEPPDLVIIGHQWWWEVRYPKANVITANEIHLPAGQRLLVELQAEDVLHSFWLPSLARKMDMIPGQTRRLWLEAPEPGEYSGACTEFCGAQHAWMRLLVTVHPPAEFADWLAQQAQPPPRFTAGDEAAGERLFQERTCSSCHAIGDIAAGVNAGPELNHLASRKTLVAGVIENTPKNLAAWLANPQAIKPGTLMPNLYLTDTEVRQLVAYLEALP